MEDRIIYENDILKFVGNFQSLHRVTNDNHLQIELPPVMLLIPLISKNAIKFSDTKITKIARAYSVETSVLLRCSQTQSKITLSRSK